MIQRLILPAVLLMLALCSNCWGQSIVVKPRKVTYNRSGKNVPDHKRTFTVVYPAFSSVRSPAILRKLEAGTNFWKVFDISLDENLTDDHWLSTLDFEVTYNEGDLFDIAMIMEGVGAYPEKVTRHVVFDLTSGEILRLSDLFESAKLRDLLDMIRSVMKSKELEATGDPDVRSMLADVRRIDPHSYPTVDKIEFKDLNGFSIGDRGVTFYYDYDYPHAAKGLEPFSEFTISYQDLKPFTRNEGLLARFVR